MRRFMYSSFLVIWMLVGAVLLPTATASGQANDCTLPSRIYLLDELGNDANNGLTVETPVLTIKRARELASVGGGCIYQVSGSNAVPIETVEAEIKSTGIPLAPTLVYGLLLLLTIALIGGGMWARRQSMRLQPRVIS